MCINGGVLVSLGLDLGFSSNLVVCGGVQLTSSVVVTPIVIS